MYDTVGKKKVESTLGCIFTLENENAEIFPFKNEQTNNILL